MRRRDLLGSLAAAMAVGSAGCQYVGGDSDEPMCSTPNGELRDALPSSGEYSNPSIDDNNTAEEVSGATQHVFASYQTDDGRFLFVIGQYDTPREARDAATDSDTWMAYADGVVGTLAVDSYAYVVMGPDEAGVRNLLAEADPLNEACVEENITIL